MGERSVGHPARKEHWETVYQTKALETVGWYQPVPAESLELIESLELSHRAAIIDVGGGDSLLSDQLLQRGYTDLTVLDISGAALRRARQRHGRDAKKIYWIESDVLEFTPERTYDLWHDRATFHFFTKGPQIKRYLEIAHRVIRPGGHLVLGTFSDKGPPTCSGLPVQRYSIAQQQGTVNPFFKMIRGVNLDHQTPSGGIQAYTFGLFNRVE